VTAIFQSVTVALKIIFLILSLQTASAVCRTINKNKRTLSGTDDQQGAKRAGIVSGLCAGRTVDETMSYGDFNKNPVYEDKWSSTNLLLLEDLLIRVSNRKFMAVG
jgi:hypothetical protein